MKHTLYLVLGHFLVSGRFRTPGRNAKLRSAPCALSKSAASKRSSSPILDGGKSPEIPLYTDVSPVVQGVFKTNEAAFYIEKAGPDGKPMLELVGKTPIGKSDRQLFLFLPGGKGEGKPVYQVRSFDDDTRTFGMGIIRAINLAPVPVRFVLVRSDLARGPAREIRPVSPFEAGQWLQHVSRRG